MCDLQIAKPRALVAEDDRVLADVIRLALARAGFDVIVASDGRTALSLAMTYHFPVISTDYQMPYINGELILRAIRAEGPNRDSTLILCTAKAYELNSESLRSELKLASVLYKPLSLAELVRAAETSLLVEATSTV